MGTLSRISRNPVAGPILTGGAGLLMLIFIDVGSDTSLIVDENALGPLSWPRVMILGTIITSVIWGFVRVRSTYRTGSAEVTPVAIDPVRLAIGIIVIVGYGTVIVFIGFAIATFLFLLCWLWLGGFRKLVPLLSCSLVGTLALLYLFLKVAYLPLPRGTGWMETFTIALYQYLGIF